MKDSKLEFRTKMTEKISVQLHPHKIAVKLNGKNDTVRQDGKRFAQFIWDNVSASFLDELELELHRLQVQLDQEYPLEKEVTTVADKEKVNP